MRIDFRSYFILEHPVSAGEYVLIRLGPLEAAQGSVSAGEERDGYYPGHRFGLGLAWPGCTKLGYLR